MGKGKWNNRLHLVAFVNSIIRHFFSIMWKSLSMWGSRTSSKKHMKKLHSILRYAERSRGFTEIKQVLVASKFAGVQWGLLLGTHLF